jgi:hypothetical protein
VKLEDGQLSIRSRNAFKVVTNKSINYGTRLSMK